MFQYQIITEPENFTLEDARIEEIFEAIAREVGISQNGILNIAFVSDEQMQEYNRAYRGINKTTDVLSFHYFEDFEEISPDEIAGECIFSESKIIAQASKHEHSPKEEFEILLIHSVLHILGYDHESDEDFAEMWKYEKKLREEFHLNTAR